MKTHSNKRTLSQVEAFSLLELVDGAYEIVELFNPKSPAQKSWKENWLEKAKKLGASPEW